MLKTGEMTLKMSQNRRLMGLAIRNELYPRSSARVTFFGGSDTIEVTVFCSSDDLYVTITNPFI